MLPFENHFLFRQNDQIKVRTMVFWRTPLENHVEISLILLHKFNFFVKYPHF